MPRQTRTARARRRAARTDLPNRAPAPAAPTPGEAPPRPASARETTATATVVRPPATPATPVSRGLVTDYGYIISELKRIFLLSASIFVLLIILWFIFG